VCTGGYTGTSCATAPAVTGFTTVWHVGYAGYGNTNNTVRFTVTTTTSPMIDWGDGTIEVLTATPSHTYAMSGDYTIKMNGISRFSSYGGGSDYHGKLISVTDWGGIAWTSMQSMFQYADHLNLLPATGPNMVGVTNMSYMFAGTYLFNQSLTTFNTANVTDMSYLFYGATAFNQPLTSFNTANVTTMRGMFQGATVFNSSLATLNTANVTNM
jgi:surface protein